MVISKYENLAQYLAGKGEDMLRMTFEEIERHITGPLPPAAFEHRAWWANSDSQNHAVNGWLQAGWETSRVDMDNKELFFVRLAPALQYQFAMPSEPRYRGRSSKHSRGDMVSTELESILNRAGGIANLSNILDAIEQYIKGDLQEMELGQKLRGLWNKRP